MSIAERIGYASIFCLLLCWEASAQAPQQPGPAIDPLTEKILVAGASAILSLLTGYILYVVKESREPKKRLSYDLEVRHGLLGVEEQIAKDLSVSYKGRAAENITYVRCDVRNSGNTLIKDQFLRFDFGAQAQILDAYTDPVPPIEYDVEETDDLENVGSQRRYKIGHLEKRQDVGLRFVLSGTVQQEIIIIPFNEQGDVEVIPGSISRAADDRRLVERFIMFYILLILLPPLFRWIPGNLRDFALTALYILLVGAMVPLLLPFTRVVASAIIALGRRDKDAVSISGLHQEQDSTLNIVVGKTER
jgi:hypothetical protein